MYDSQFRRKREVMYGGSGGGVERGRTIRKGRVTGGVPEKPPRREHPQARGGQNTTRGIKQPVVQGSIV